VVTARATNNYRITGYDVMHALFAAAAALHNAPIHTKKMTTFVGFVSGTRPLNAFTRTRSPCDLVYMYIV